MGTIPRFPRFTQRRQSHEISAVLSVHLHLTNSALTVHFFGVDETQDKITFAYNPRYPHYYNNNNLVIYIEI